MLIRASAFAKRDFPNFFSSFIRFASVNNLEFCTLLTVRPKVAELQFQLYSRALHPELFQIHGGTEVSRGDYSARIDITSAGHVVTWNYDGQTLTEVAAAANHPLPEKRRLMKHRLHGDRTDEVTSPGGVKYQVSFQLQIIKPQMFWTIQQELAKDGHKKGTFYEFQSSGRMAMGAMSYVYPETRDRSLLIQSFHTFPDDHAIVKVQSSFKLPSKK